MRNVIHFKAVEDDGIAHSSSTFDKRSLKREWFCWSSQKLIELTDKLNCSENIFKCHSHQAALILSILLLSSVCTKLLLGKKDQISQSTHTQYDLLKVIELWKCICLRDIFSYLLGQ